MYNEHNPVARLVETLQQRWVRQTAAQPHCRMIRWMMHPEQAPLVNGFSRLESSPYGKTASLLVVMLTAFEEAAGFSALLVQQWGETWQQESNTQRDRWDAGPWLQQAAHPGAGTSLLVGMLDNFHQHCAHPGQALVLGLLPRSIRDTRAYSQWLLQLMELLPAHLRVMTVDHIKEPLLKPVVQHNPARVCTIDISDLNLEKAMEQVATGGNPHQPDVQYRKCLFEMGKATRSRNTALLNSWGDQLLQTAQRSGDKTLWATAHVIYAGFLMHFKESERIHALLDKAIYISQPLYRKGTGNCGAILMQAYGYKAAYLNMTRRKAEAIEWMDRQLQMALEQELWMYALTLCKTLAFLAEEKGEDRLQEQYTTQGYELGQRLNAEEARASEYLMLAKDYYDRALRERKTEQAAEADARMTALFGTGWQSLVQKKQKGYTSLTPVTPVEKLVNL